MAGENDNFETYEQFWPFYLSQHRQRATRLIHIGGTILAVIAIILAVLTGGFFWLLLAPAVGYGAAWVGHAFVEKNRPATFAYPLWSLAGDFHMLWLWLTGRLETELAQHKILT